MKNPELINRRSLNKIIIATPEGAAFRVRHDIPDEHCEIVVPTLEIAGTIVKALRERQQIKLSLKLLEEHRQRELKKAADKLKRRK